MIKEKTIWSSIFLDTKFMVPTFGELPLGSGGVVTLLFESALDGAYLIGYTL
jgi:hypothetical protein